MIERDSHTEQWMKDLSEMTGYTAHEVFVLHKVYSHLLPNYPELSRELTERTYDLMSFCNIEGEEVSIAISKAIVHSPTDLAKYGVDITPNIANMSREDIARLILEKSADAKGDAERMKDSSAVSGRKCRQTFKELGKTVREELPFFKK